MIYKGYHFRISKTVLPYGDDEQNRVLFGKICKSSCKNAIKTRYVYTEIEDPVYVKPIPNDGYSRTNMMYGKDGRIYLAYDGRCYTARWKK